MRTGKFTKANLKKEKEQLLCQTCRTGAETLRIDPYSYLCPYIGNLKDNKCSMYKELIREDK